MARSDSSSLHASEPASDGRARRSERSRESIVQALMELIGEGSLRPTAQQVAERAGVGIRTVFRHFRDMETLYAEMSARLRATLHREPAAAPTAGRLSERVQKLAERRAELFERSTPYQRSAALHRWRSAYLQGQHASEVRELRADLLRWLPELEDATPECLDAAELATSFEAWDRLRSEQRLSRSRATAAMEATLLRLVA